VLLVVKGMQMLNFSLKDSILLHESVEVGRITLVNQETSLGPV
jgi:hypothetical protein